MFGFDEGFVKQLVVGHRPSFNAFYLKTVDSFSRYIQSHYSLSVQDNEDIIADFYVKLWRTLSRFDSGGNFQAFVWSMFKNHVKDHFKKNHELSFGDVSTNTYRLEDELISDHDVKKLLDKDFAYDSILSAMKGLDEESQELLYLKYIEQESHDMIAELLGVSIEVVRKRLSRALGKLKRVLIP